MGEFKRAQHETELEVQKLGAWCTYPPGVPIQRVWYYVRLPIGS